MRARLADRQIREAALRAAPTLDVRGPVSEALGRAGIVVPPAEPAPPKPAAPLATEGHPARPRKTAGGVAAPDPVVKPFTPAPWPTRAERTDDPERALSGLTADERRVHRILLDSLERENTRAGGSGLSYVEKKRLATLDLAFINAQLAKMDRGLMNPDVLKPSILAGTTLTGITAAVLVDGGTGKGLALLAGVAVGLVIVFLSTVLRGAFPSSRTPSPRRQIYEALRELALLVDDAPVSDALAQADRLIDTFAEPAAPPRTSAPPRRVRS